MTSKGYTNVCIKSGTSKRTFHEPQKPWQDNRFASHSPTQMVSHGKLSSSHQITEVNSCIEELGNTSHTIPPLSTRSDGYLVEWKVKKLWMALAAENALNSLQRRWDCIYIYIYIKFTFTETLKLTHIFHLWMLQPAWALCHLCGFIVHLNWAVKHIEWWTPILSILMSGSSRREYTSIYREIYICLFLQLLRYNAIILAQRNLNAGVKFVKERSLYVY